MTDHALVIVGHISAQDSSITVTQTPLWFQVTQAAAAVATTVGVLIALYVATIREPRKAAAERRRSGEHGREFPQDDKLSSGQGCVNELVLSIGNYHFRYRIAVANALRCRGLISDGYEGKTFRENLLAF